MNQYRRLLHTIKYLRFVQIFYRIYYLLRNKIRQVTKHAYPLSISSHSHPLTLMAPYTSQEMVVDRSFTFLNITQDFDDDIDWDYPGYGKLWTYNLTYFDFLNQEEMTRDEGLRLIDNFIVDLEIITDGLEPYPISLRGINWIKFLSRRGIRDQSIDDALYAQYLILMDNLEYHLLGNHLLENGFSLLFGAFYYRDERLYETAIKVLLTELDEQILEDGAHFELSPMYHQIILFRVLDCLDLVLNNYWKDERILLEILQNKAALMLGWLEEMTFLNGDIPLFNDSAKGIAPTTQELRDYANSLDVHSVDSRLSSSGYRVKKSALYEIIVDVGNIGPDYIPGHAHSDTFNFELHYRGRPLIVDTGISTYETNQRRTLERSTCSHNTVELSGLEQSEVWGGFRVARRAYIKGLKEDENSIEAKHNGYEERLHALHQRRFVFDDDNIIILDSILTNRSVSAIARLHFHPDIRPRIEGDIIMCDNLQIKCKNASLAIKPYSYADRFNILRDAKMVEIGFSDRLEVKISLS